MAASNTNSSPETGIPGAADSLENQTVAGVGDSMEKDQIAPSNLDKLQAQNEYLIAEVYSLRSLYQTLELMYNEVEGNLVNSQMKNDDFERIIGELRGEIEGGMREKESLEREIYEGVREREELVGKIDVGMREKEDLMRENEGFKVRNGQLKEERRERERFLARSFEGLDSIKECLVRVCRCLDDEEKMEIRVDGSEEIKKRLGFERPNLKGKLNVLGEFSSESGLVLGKLSDYQEKVDSGADEGEEMKGNSKSDEGNLEGLNELGDFSSDSGSVIVRKVEGKLSNYRQKRDSGADEDEEMKENLNSERGNLKGLNELGDSLSDSGSVIVRRARRRLSDYQEKVDYEADESEEMNANLKGLNEIDDFLSELDTILGIVKRVEAKLSDYQEKTKKDKKELERSVVSLTEENRDINSLLRIALLEKEAVERNLNKLKGNNEQKRVALLQIAERGLQRVGFGFMMGAAANEQSLETTTSNASSVSDSSECEEEVVSLASTVEKIMKNLRLEITQLRKALDESRSDNERLQSLTEKQARRIAEQTMYIRELEDRERLLAHNVEELLIEIKATEEEVARWREACELEVEAGKHAIEERDKLAAILQQELEKTRTALEVSNNKLKLKEELATAAMAVQAAAEKSLRLADSRAAELRQRTEELTRQLEEVESRDRGGKRTVRRICWPWQALRVNPANAATSRVRNFNVRHFIPEMQALLPYNV